MTLTRRQKYWFVWSYFYSAIIRAVLLLIPFRWVSLVLGKHYKKLELSCPVSIPQQVVAKEIGEIITLACRYTPWESKCLVQAILARNLLKKYQIPCVMYLGVTKTNDTKELKAHAWSCVDRYVITGGNEYARFSIVSTFVTPGSLIEPSSNIKQR